MYHQQHVEPVPASRPFSSPTVPSTEVATISVATRIPDFWRDQPRLWFAQFDAIMAPQKQGDETKYNLVITKLGKEEIQETSDIILTPPETGKYNALRERLLKVYEESEARQLQKLLSEVDLGDQKPSCLLRRMRELARGKVPDDTLRIMWNQHLPSAVRAVLTVTETKDLDKLADIADKVMDSVRSTEIAQVSSSQSSIDGIAKQLNELALAVNEMQNCYCRPLQIDIVPQTCLHFGISVSS